MSAQQTHRTDIEERERTGSMPHPLLDRDETPDAPAGFLRRIGAVAAFHAAWVVARGG